MGRAGPKKTPTAIKKQRGTYRKDRDAGVEIIGGGVGEPPDGLHPIAARTWRELASKLAAAKVISDVDALAWLVGMTAFSDWLRATDALAGQQLVGMTDKGYEYPNPLIAIRNRSWADTLKFAREFGLTPSARSGLRITITPAALDPLAEHGVD